ncbi:MAG: Spy/CpxP family protein refolding chaperone [Rhodoferax sp.]|nr:Spy/CpxP family protein refolding chaperone [Rhodoferax sp.]
MFHHSLRVRKSTMAHLLYRRWKSTLFSAFAVTLLVAGLSACGHRSHEYSASMSAEQFAQKRDKMVDKAASKLDLTQDQKARLVVLGDKLYAQKAALIGATTDPRAEMKALVAGNTFDATRAQAIVNEKTAALMAKSPDVIAALANFYNSLNTEQQQKVRDYMDGHGHWFRRG